LVLPLLLLAALAACQGWYRQPLGPEPRTLPSPARLTLVDGTRYVVYGAAVERDSVISVVGRAGERTRWAVPISDVRRIDAQETHAAEISGIIATGLIVLIIAAGTVLQPST
jgi:hypothetical protein